MKKVAVITEQERLDRLRLIRTENVGPVSYLHLLRRYGSAKAALEALPHLASRGGRSVAIAIYPRELAEQEAETLAAAGGHFIALGEADYPPALAAIEDAPPVISLIGQPLWKDRRCVALVGARNASASGRRLAEELARDLGAAAFVVVSGMARGIDGAAHKGALASGTIAVLAGGVDNIYPPEHEDLYRRIAETGAVISEMPVGTIPQARHFPRRNRVISGLSLGVLAVEAALQSGSLITARLALEQGREVMAVPGSPLDPRCRGTNNLLRQGAVLVESAADVLAALEGASGLSSSKTLTFELADQPAEISNESLPDGGLEAVAALLGPTPIAVDELTRWCQLSAPVVRAALLELDLAGRLEWHPGNRISLLLTNKAQRS
ncbi:MAG TPA: DNA-processing protein DprA [Verrucomicrobiae bacterium]|nr:DNA-processing protein DprA [Verrucomicrobiae bacterium]